MRIKPNHQVDVAGITLKSDEVITFLELLLGIMKSKDDFCLLNRLDDKYQAQRTQIKATLISC